MKIGLDEEYKKLKEEKLDWSLIEHYKLELGRESLILKNMQKLKS
jgi:hypothetical protein